MEWSHVSHFSLSVYIITVPMHFSQGLSKHCFAVNCTGHFSLNTQTNDVLSHTSDYIYQVKCLIMCFQQGVSYYSPNKAFHYGSPAKHFITKSEHIWLHIEPPISLHYAEKHMNLGLWTFTSLNQFYYIPFHTNSWQHIHENFRDQVLSSVRMLGE